MTTSVWAFQPLPELQNATGLVECDDDLAMSLIADGKAQDPRDGAFALKEIIAAAPAERDSSYETKVMTPRAGTPQPQRRARRDENP